MKIFALLLTLSLFIVACGSQQVKETPEEKVTAQAPAEAEQPVKEPVMEAKPTDFQAEVATMNQQLNDALIDEFVRGRADIPEVQWKEFAKMAAPVIKMFVDRVPEGYVIQVTGHTDSTGNNTINAKLSRQRAQAVYDQLLKEGLRTKKLVVKGVGTSMLIQGVDSTDGKQRRVSFEIVKASK